jgi:hypothetical protein
MAAEYTSETSITLSDGGNTEHTQHKEILETETKATNDDINASCCIHFSQPSCPFRVGIATGYGLEGRGSILEGVRFFSSP